MNDAVDRHTTSNDGLQTATFHIRDNLRVDLAIAFEQAEHDRFS
jgi:hypothetical protein